MDSARDSVARSLLKALQAVVEDEQIASDAIYLTAFENRPSALVQQAINSPLGNRYQLGSYYDTGLSGTVLRGGLLSRAYTSVRSLEQMAHRATEQLFDAKHSEFRIFSGLTATTTALALLAPAGVVVYSMSPFDGGHFATQTQVKLLGRRSAFLPTRRNWTDWDIREVRKAFARRKPGVILFDCGVQLSALEVDEVVRAAGDGVLAIFDASHTLGLIAGGVLPSPFSQGCTVIQGNTHKSFFGPHRGLIMFSDAAEGRNFSRLLGESFVSSQLTSLAMGLYVSLIEATCFGSEYARRVVHNANQLAAGLCAADWHVARLDAKGAFTETNMLLVSAGRNVEPYELCRRLANVGIVCNARQFRGTAVLRIGLQEVTRRGFTDSALVELTDIMTSAAMRSRPIRSVASRVRDLSRSFPTVEYSFDSLLKERGHDAPS